MRREDIIVAEKRITKCKVNIAMLNNMLSKYESCDFNDILQTLPEKYRVLEKKHREDILEKWKNAPFEQYPKNEEKHRHETHIGEL